MMTPRCRSRPRHGRHDVEDVREEGENGAVAVGRARSHDHEGVHVGAAVLEGASVLVEMTARPELHRCGQAEEDEPHGPAGTMVKKGSMSCMLPRKMSADRTALTMSLVRSSESSRFRASFSISSAERPSACWGAEAGLFDRPADVAQAYLAGHILHTDGPAVAFTGP